MGVACCKQEHKDANSFTEPIESDADQEVNESAIIEVYVHSRSHADIYGRDTCKSPKKIFTEIESNPPSTKAAEQLRITAQLSASDTNRTLSATPRQRTVYKICVIGFNESAKHHLIQQVLQETDQIRTTDEFPSGVVRIQAKYCEMQENGTVQIFVTGPDDVLIRKHIRTADLLVAVADEGSTEEAFQLVCSYVCAAAAGLRVLVVSTAKELTNKDYDAVERQANGKATSIEFCHVASEGKDQDIPEWYVLTSKLEERLM